MSGRHGEIAGYRTYGMGSGLATVIVNIDGEGPEMIHGDYNCIYAIHENLPVGSRVVVVENEEDPFSGPGIVPEEIYAEEVNN